MRNFRPFLFITMLLVVSQLFAQDDFQKWLQKDQQDFQSFIEQEDKDFSNFLKQEWSPFKTEKGEVPDTSPKPVSLPKAPEKKTPSAPPQTPPMVLKNLPIPTKRPQPVELPLPKPEPQKPAIRFSYFDVPLSVEYKPAVPLDLTAGIQNKTISKSWEAMSAPGYKPMIEQLQNMKRLLELNDWGYLQLAQNFAQAVYKKDANKQALLIWFVLNKSGYDTRVAYSKNSVYILFPSQDEIFNNKFVQIDGTRYYFLQTLQPAFKLDTRVYTYRKNYKTATKPISMRLYKIPQLKREILKKEFKFTFNRKPVQVPVQFDKDVVTFFKYYPQTDLKVYFSAPMSNEGNFSLLSALRTYVENMPETEAVNFLLRFVQTSFNYKTDDQQFGHEKYLMPEETMYYPSSDCEDRSILFSYLVTHLLGLRVIGLDYPGHIATAVQFHTPIGGKTVTYKNMPFTICDPTYVNADAGMCMPQFENVKPKIISLF